MSILAWQRQRLPLSPWEPCRQLLQQSLLRLGQGSFFPVIILLGFLEPSVIWKASPMPLAMSTTRRSALEASAPSPILWWAAVHLEILSPIISASVTIDGHTVDVGGNYNSQILAANGYYADLGIESGQYAQAWNTALVAGVETSNYVVQEIYNYLGTIRGSITSPFIYNAVSDGILGDYAGGGLELHSYDYGTGAVELALSVALIPDQLTVSLGAPEPSTWAMMALGFAGLGFAGYRRAPKVA